MHNTRLSRLSPPPPWPTNAGALNAKRLAGFKERVLAMAADPELPPFLYGSHYSNAGTVRRACHGRADLVWAPPATRSALHEPQALAWKITRTCADACMHARAQTHACTCVCAPTSSRVQQPPPAGFVLSAAVGALHFPGQTPARRSLGPRRPAVPLGGSHVEQLPGQLLRCVYAWVCVHGLFC